MNLFSKEKGVILLLLNAIFIIWGLVAIILSISNLTPLLIKEYEYSYQEYQMAYCFDYETEDECKSDYTIYKINSKSLSTEEKRSIVISMSNFVLVSTTLILLNKKRNKKSKN